jgi:hypothetical protein
MKFEKKMSLGGQYAKKGEDIKNGDTIIIKDGGTVTQGQFGEQNVFKIETRNGEKNLSINQTSINSLIDKWGEESESWVEKKVKVHAIKQNVAGKFINVYYIAPEGYEMGENGFELEGNQSVREEDIPIVNVDEII